MLTSTHGVVLSLIAIAIHVALTTFNSTVEVGGEAYILFTWAILV